MLKEQMSKQLSRAGPPFVAVAGINCNHNLPKVEGCQGPTYRILNMMDLDGRGESAHATRTFSLQFPLGGFSHSEIKIAHCSCSVRGIDSSSQSNYIRNFRNDQYKCRPLQCLQGL